MRAHRVLAEDLVALLRREPPAAQPVPVDLDELSSFLDGDLGESTTVWLDLRTGDLYSGDFTEPAMGGEDAAIDVDSQPDRWLWLERTGPRDGWEDMQEFALRQHDRALRDRLTHAIEGKGAFGRSRDLVHDEGLAEQWQVFSDDHRALHHVKGHYCATRSRMPASAFSDPQLRFAPRVPEHPEDADSWRACRAFGAWSATWSGP